MSSCYERCVGLLGVIFWIQKLFCFLKNDFRVDKSQCFFGVLPITPTMALVLMADSNVSNGCFSEEVDNFFVINVPSASIMVAGRIAEAVNKDYIFDACFFK